MWSSPSPPPRWKRRSPRSSRSWRKRAPEMTAQPMPEAAEQGNSTEALLGRIGQLTRQLREGLRELGLDKQVERAAQAIPDARDRLSYVAATTERAAHRALNAIDLAQPLQEKLATGAGALNARWDEWFANPIELNDARELVLDTRTYLREVPKTAEAINAQLM